MDRSRRAASSLCCLIFALACLTGPSLAEDCFGGGVSCEEAARAAFDFRLARDCATLFAIKPSLRTRFERIIDIVKSRPLASLYPEQFSADPRPMKPGDCERVARNLTSGTPEQRKDLEYLVIRTGAGR